MDKKLEKRIENLKREAIKKDFYERAITILKELGRVSKSDLLKLNLYTPDWVYRSGNLVIKGRDYSVVTIKEGEQVVFQGKQCRFASCAYGAPTGVYAYVPGNWENNFQNAHSIAASKEKSKEIAREEKENQEKLEEERRQLIGFGLASRV